MNYRLSMICALMLHLESSFANDDSVAEKFAQYQLVPDVVNKAPSDFVTIFYNTSEVNLGNELSPKAVIDPPTYIAWNAENQMMYTFILADPDAPSRNNAVYRSWRHYVVANIVGSNMSTGTILSSYIGPEPPVKTGLHRYAFLVYKQAGLVHAPPVEDFTARQSWNVSQWALDNKLGDPVAGNFFQCRNADDQFGRCASLSFSLTLGFVIVCIFCLF